MKFEHTEKVFLDPSVNLGQYKSSRDTVVKANNGAGKEL